MAIELGRLFEDYDWSNEVKRPDSVGELIYGKRGKLLSVVNYPGGEGPWPVVIFCHGLPGTERLLDFALALRQAGFCTITFHYSGSWGSDGNFSLTHCMEDVLTVAEYVSRDEKGLFDLRNVFVCGLSMGGLMGAYLLANCDFVKAGAIIMPGNMTGFYLQSKESPEAAEAMKAKYDGIGEWLKGFSWAVLAREVGENPERFHLATYGEPLAKKPVLAVAGSMDVVAPKEKHLDLLTAAIRAHGGTLLEETTIATDHCMCDQRNAIRRAVAEFFAKNMD